jgi:hypothetical protein
MHVPTIPAKPHRNPFIGSHHSKRAFIGRAQPGRLRLAGRWKAGLRLAGGRAGVSSRNMADDGGEIRPSEPLESADTGADALDVDLDEVSEAATVAAPLPPFRFGPLSLLCFISAAGRRRVRDSGRGDAAVAREHPQRAGRPQRRRRARPHRRGSPH